MGINIWKLKLQTGLALASVLEGKPWAECQDATAQGGVPCEPALQSLPVHLAVLHRCYLGLSPLRSRALGTPPTSLPSSEGGKEDKANGCHLLHSALWKHIHFSHGPPWREVWH